MTSTQTNTQNRRILIVDDNATIHNSFNQILGESDTHDSSLDESEVALFGEDITRADTIPFELESAYQGQDALECVKKAVVQAPYAMAFVDVRMPPGWDGVETIQRIWGVDPAMQIVICSAHNDYSWQDIRHLFGESDQLLILKKPFEAAEVRQLAVALTTKWSISRELKIRLNELDDLVRDRTEALQAQQKELEKTHAQLLLAQKLESIGQLAAGIAHEINTPTQFIGDNVRFLATAFDDLLTMLTKYEAVLDPEIDDLVREERRRSVASLDQDLDIAFIREEVPNAIAQVLDGIGRVTTIVRSMKEFSHPGAAEKSSIDLNKAIESTITVARNEWKYVAEVVTEFDPALPTVSCLQGDMNQVFLNLIINAAHAITDVVGDGTLEKGIIRVSTRLDDVSAEIRVSDTGTGIPDRIRAKIFDPFFTTKEVGKGTGQGLAIAHNVVVDKHGGTIKCESEVGKGTTFVIRLPINASVVEAAGVT
jgi:signal transduction histidine kinase